MIELDAMKEGTITYREWFLTKAKELNVLMNPEYLDNCSQNQLKAIEFMFNQLGGNNEL